MIDRISSEGYPRSISIILVGYILWFTGGWAITWRAYEGREAGGGGRELISGSLRYFL